MALRVFVSQSTIDTWVSTDQVDLQGDVITIKPSGIQVRLAPAAYFVSVSGGSADSQDVIGKVKDQEAIAAMGGEAYMSSVVIGEDAYDVEPGFLASAADGGAGSAALVAALSVMQH